jgi:hypothetical protein
MVENILNGFHRTATTGGDHKEPQRQSRRKITKKSDECSVVLL